MLSQKQFMPRRLLLRLGSACHSNSSAIVRFIKRFDSTGVCRSTFLCRAPAGRSIVARRRHGFELRPSRSKSAMVAWIAPSRRVARTQAVVLWPDQP